MRNSNSTLSKPSILLTPKKVATGLLFVVIILHLLNLLGVFLYSALGYRNFFTNALVSFFYVTEEYNIPALFSALNIFLGATLCFLIYLIPDSKNYKYKKHWLVLSLIFLFLSIDEAISIHEEFNRLQKILPDNYAGYLKYAWILPYAAFAILAGAFFLKFLWHLPVRTKKLFIVAGSVYVLATIGFEPIEGHIVDTYGPKALSFFLFCSVEEFLEMTSIVLFNYALLDYASLFNPSILISQNERSVSISRYPKSDPLVKSEQAAIEHAEIK